MILVIGSTGLLGSEIVRRLRRFEYPVRAMARETSSPERLRAIQETGAEVVFGDLKEPETLRAACNGMDAVIATASSTLSRQAGDSIQTVDLEGCLNLIEAARGAGVRRFVYISIPPNLHESPLTRAKAEVIRRLMASGLEYTVLAANYFMEVWLSPALGFDAFNGHVRLYGTGDRPITLVSCNDVAEIAVRSLSEERARNRQLLVGGPANVTPLQVVRLFEKVVGRSITMDHVSEAALEEKWCNPTSALDETFAGLMMDFAQGCTMDMRETLALFPIHLTTVEEFAAATLETAGAHA